VDGERWCPGFAGETFREEGPDNFDVIESTPGFAGLSPEYGAGGRKRDVLPV
jgi:hypothetical protein